LPGSSRQRQNSFKQPGERFLLVEFVPLGLIRNFHDLRPADGLSRLILPGANR
jgi:hypothetical protein